MANPQPPVGVHAHAGPITSDCTFCLDAGCIVVVKTPFLHWVPAPGVVGGPPRAGLGTFQLLYAFGARLRSAAAPAVVAAVQGASPFTLRLSAAAWSRIFGELVLAGIFDGAGAIEDYEELQGRMESSTYPTPANLHVADADLTLGQAFTLPGGNGAAAVRDRELLTQVRFLHLATVALLEDGSARSPWKAMTTLIACIGPCLTNASRMDETSHVQDFASLFRSRRPECTTDGSLARALRTITSDVRLPYELRPATLSPIALAEAAIDGLNYQSMDRRPGIEERRIDLMVRKAPFLRSATTALAPSAEMALRSIRTLSNLLLPESARQGDLSSQLSALEAAIGLHGAALHIALNVNHPTLDSVQRALVDDHTLAGQSTSIQPAAAASAGDGGAPTAPATNEALRGHHHKALVALLKGLDLETSTGIHQAIGEAFNGTMLLPARVLFSTSALGDPVSKRDETLARINDLRPHLTGFLEHSLKLDPATGVERPEMKHYRLTDANGAPSAFATSFWELALDKIPWIDAPYGYLGYQQRVDSNEHPAALPAADHFCIPSVMEGLADFAQKLFSAIGMEANVDAADGYGMSGFCRFYAKHLKLAARLQTRQEQIRWLQTSVTLWHSAMALAGTSLHALIFSSNVAALNLATFQCPRRQASGPAFTTAARPLIRADSPAVVALLQMQTALANVKSFKASTDIYGDGGGSSSSVAYEDVQLPRLSSLKRSNPNPNLDTRQKPLGKGKELKTTPKADVDTGPPASQGAPPGSLAQSWRYLQGGKTLIVSGRAWKIPGLCKHLGVKPGDICWPFALCLATKDQARLARCDKFGKPNHGSVGKGAHVLLDLAKLDSFWRPATVEEKKGLVSAIQTPSDTGGRGQGKGKGRGRNAGRGRGRGGQPSNLLQDMDDVDSDDDGGAAFLALTHRSGAGRQGDEKRPRSPSPSTADGPASHPFVLLGRDLSSFAAGNSDAVASAPIDTLPSPKAPASAATQRNALHSPMRTLAAHVLNEGRLLIDVGGQGQCGPNTLSFQIGLLDSVLKLGAPDGPTLRAACCKHILDRDIQRRVTSLTDEYGMPMSLGQLVIDAMLHWPSCSFDGGVSVENWCKMISKPETWTDIAFLQIVSDVCGVAIHVTGVSDLSEVIPNMLLILPCDRRPPKALLRVGYWLDRHLVAIVDLQKEKGAAPADLPDGRPPPPPGPACSATDPPSSPVLQPRAVGGPAAAWDAEPSTAVVESSMQRESLSRLQAERDVDELWARGKDPTTLATLLLSSCFSAPLDIRPSVLPAPAPERQIDLMVQKVRAHQPFLPYTAIAVALRLCPSASEAH